MPASRNSKTRIRGIKLGIIASRFNEFITLRLLQGCLDELKKNGLSQKDIQLLWVPGSFEIPVAALKLVRQKNISAVICLGAVIRGETFHFEIVAQQAASGIMRVSLDSGKPVVFGVLTTDTIEQAYKRSEPKGDNKGRDGARTALEMIDVLKTH